MRRHLKITVENATFQQFHALKTNRKKRSKTGWFLVESVKAINLAIENDWDIHAIIVRSGELSDWALETIDNLHNAELYEMSDPLLRQLSDREEMPELILIAMIRTLRLNDLRLQVNPFVVVLDRPGNPGNLGSIIRSCDALGIDAIVITGHGADLYDPQTIRSSIGTIFSMQIIHAESFQAIHKLKSNIHSIVSDVQIVGTSARGDMELSSVDFRKPTILIVGNETFGMSENFAGLSDIIAKIPIQGSASSLNVACATSVVLYEAIRQRSI